jgi:hypothetical protein
MDDFEIIEHEEDVKSEPADKVEPVSICPICQCKCSGAEKLMEHYWVYCKKTRTYFDAHIDNFGASKNVD